MRSLRAMYIAVIVMTSGWLAGQSWAGPQLGGESAKSAASEASQVQGFSCYRMSADESLLSVQKKALTLAREDALKRIKTFVESTGQGSAHGLDPEIVAAAGRVGLSNERITRQEVKAGQVCVGIAATPNSKDIADLIKQRLNAKALAQTLKVDDPVVATSVSRFGMKVWTNKKEGEPFVEGERLIIYVESEKDAYLKLDYYTAEGKVVHLVPNVFTSEARIQGGQKYSFGDDGAAAEFKISGPFGDETIKALVSTIPFDPALATTDQISDSIAYLKKVQTVLKAKAKESTWSSAMVALVTSNKDDLQAARERKKIAGSGPRGPGSSPPGKPEQPIDIIGVPGREK